MKKNMPALVGSVAVFALLAGVAASTLPGSLKTGRNHPVKTASTSQPTDVPQTDSLHSQTDSLHSQIGDVQSSKLSDGRQVVHHKHVGYGQVAYYQSRVVIVTFHDISPDVYSPYVITPQAFNADLDALQSQFNVITNQQFIAFLNGKASVPPNAVLLTFDDGYKNMYTYALPVLQEHHLQGTFFEIVGTADKQDTKKLSWSEIKTMSRDGMFFGSHTYDSHYVVQEPFHRLVAAFNTRIRVNGQLETQAEYSSRVYSDFVKARIELSHATNQPITEFAWPYGYGTRKSTAIAHEAGYDYLFTTASGYVTANSNRSYIHRIDVGKSTITPEQAVQAIIDTGEGIRSRHGLSIVRTGFQHQNHVIVPTSAKHV